MTKKGAKGTSDFKVFFLKAISPVPIMAPIRKDKNRATEILGQPRRRPRKKTNLTSPKPNQRPRDTKNIIRKRALAKKAESKG